MALADRVRQRRVATTPTTGRKAGFTMPPFWSMDGSRVALSGSGITDDMEMVGPEFERHVQQMYKDNGVIYACIAARARVFSQASFLWQTFKKGRPGEFQWNQNLELLQKPWLNGTLGEWLNLMEVDASTAGNSYATRVDINGRMGARASTSPDDAWIFRFPPDRMQILIGSPIEGIKDYYHPTCRVIGYWYRPPSGDHIMFRPEDVMHYSPLPDPQARFLGMSWLTPVVREFIADKAMTQHKTSFLKNAATPNLAITLDASVDPEEFADFVEQFKEEFGGAGNAYKTLFVGGGADVTPLSVDFKALEFTSSQGRGETRIAAAAGVHPAIVGLSEGLQGSSLNEGNFMAARRIFVDGTLRDLWNKAAPSIGTLFKPPNQSQRLMVDVRDIPFLREDDASEVETLSAAISGIRQAIEAGFEPDAATDVFTNRDIARLSGKHTGLVSVQLQEPGALGTSAGTSADQATAPASTPTNQDQPAPSTNGNGGKVRSTIPYVPA